MTSESYHDYDSNVEAVVDRAAKIRELLRKARDREQEAEGLRRQAARLLQAGMRKQTPDVSGQLPD